MVQELIYNYWESPLPSVIDREIEVDLYSDLINDIVGSRRAGKTYLMFSMIKKVLEKTDKRATIYLNFENRRLYPLSPNIFNEVISFAHQENLFSRYERIFLFFDEVQRVDGWEKFVRGIYDEFKGKIKIFVSGSSANLLSAEYGKLLTGRHLTVPVFPLSFPEFLKFKRHQLSLFSDKEVARLERLLEEYLEFGGFPEIVLTKTKRGKENLLNQFFIDILSRDVLGRAKIREGKILEDLAYYLISNTANLFSFNKIKRDFQSRGIKISVPTLAHYFHLFKNAFLFFESLIFSYNIKDQLQYPRKVYVIDSGLTNTSGFRLSQNRGRLMENLVGVHLHRRYFGRLARQIFYWKNLQGEEVDFVVKKGLKVDHLIQVSCDVNSLDTKQREMKALLKASEKLRCDRLLIVTWKEEKTEELAGKTVKFVPLWKWLIAKEVL